MSENLGRGERVNLGLQRIEFHHRAAASLIAT
jgi:hypothetical protein